MSAKNKTVSLVRDASTTEDLVDWGPQPDAMAGNSHSTGRLLYKGPGNSPEVGVWVCTPGKWKISVPRDEFCHFVSGRARYVASTGEVTEVEAGTCALFPAGYEGVAEIIETIRNVYMLV